MKSEHHCRAVRAGLLLASFQASLPSWVGM